MADNSLSLYNWGQTKKLIRNEVFRDGTHALLSLNEVIINTELSDLEEKHGYSWYRSTETVLSESPYLHWISKKKWALNEQLNLHMMNYQEVTLKPHHTVT